MDDPLEIELKLEVDAEDWQRLESASLLNGGAAETQRLVARYFDTPERDLKAAGYVLRVRREGDRLVQTVKAEGDSAGGLFARPEWERLLDRDKPVIDDASGPLARCFDPAILRRIEAIFVTDVERTKCIVRRDGSEIELAIDQGEVRSGDHIEMLREVELELHSGEPKALFDLARILNAETPIRLGMRSKSERGYRLLDGAAGQAVKSEPVILDPDGDAGASFRSIARSCLRQFRLNEALVLSSGGVEAVHQARVGIRRLRSAFSLYKSLFVGDLEADRLRVSLRGLATELGQVRDLDVLCPRFSGHTLDILAKARDAALVDLREQLRSKELRLLMIDLAEWLALGRWRTTPADTASLRQNVQLFAHDLLDEHRHRIKKHGAHIGDLSDEERHKVRIEAKKLRYAIEFFASLYSTKTARRRHREFRRALEQLQDALGELNDIVHGPHVLAGLGIEAKLPNANKKHRHELIAQAEDAFAALIDVKRFWR